MVCGFNILNYGSILVRLFEKPRFRFGFRKTEPRFRFGSVLFFVLFSFQLSASATQRTMNGFLCFNALQRWLSACVTLLMLIRSLNYTSSRDTRHSHDDEINCNCVWQCFINIYYCLSNWPKKHTFFRASVLFKCHDFWMIVFSMKLELFCQIVLFICQLCWVSWIFVY